MVRSLSVASVVTRPVSRRSSLESADRPGEPEVGAPRRVGQAQDRGHQPMPVAQAVVHLDRLLEPAERFHVRRRERSVAEHVPSGCSRRATISMNAARTRAMATTPSSRLAAARLRSSPSACGQAPAPTRTPLAAPSASISVMTGTYASPSGLRSSAWPSSRSAASSSAPVAHRAGPSPNLSGDLGGRLLVARVAQRGGPPKHELEASGPGRASASARAVTSASASRRSVERCSMPSASSRSSSSVTRSRGSRIDGQAQLDRAEHLLGGVPTRAPSCAASSGEPGAQLRRCLPHGRGARASAGSPATARRRPTAARRWRHGCCRRRAVGSEATTKSRTCSCGNA